MVSSSYPGIGKLAINNAENIIPLATTIPPNISRIRPQSGPTLPDTLERPLFLEDAVLRAVVADLSRSLS